MRRTAQTLLYAMCDFSFLCFLCLWNNVLKEVNHVQKYLQILGISFEKMVIKIRSIKVFLNDKRNDLVEEAMQLATDTCKETGVPVVKIRTARRKKIMPREKAADKPLTLDHELKRSMLKCIDRFQQEIHTRCQGMDCISDLRAQESDRILGNWTSQVSAKFG
ncbi:hypothetical protein AVEN_152965-1 [Araneus ventricosus]|uniref:Uncharacterized protein n=1 Tax=Araneus ventricosus TaxID=182803 RepID=A0A4Y2AD47_ARAVE|nr:hypothetical protein AVEN_152965-1 [Araneus ventricosus]